MTSHTSTKTFFIGLLLALLLASAIYGVNQALAQTHIPAAAEQSSNPMHPTFALLDASGQNVRDSGQPISTMTTCGQCHDTDYIASHSFHSDLGLSEYQQTGTSSGAFGKWDPLLYRYLSGAQDERLDLGTAEWLMTYGLRHVGGGPAVISRSSGPLTDLSPTPSNPETAILQPDGTVGAWDWEKSGVIEMNCFLCHMETPNNQARIAAIQAGEFSWANTATLVGSGLVEMTAEGFQWNATAFAEDGSLQAEYIFVQKPSNENCAQCHGVANRSNDPLVITDFSLNNPQTATTGQVISPQKIAASGMNIAGKDDLTRSWDVHAERQLACTDCHFSLNNPVYAIKEDSLPHLLFDPRRLSISAYLQRPDHNFARGESAQYTVAPDLKGTMRRCESCHDAETSHAQWLPYLDRHMETLACESCHIPQLYAPAIEQYDWTVLTADGQPVKFFRGIEGNRETSDTISQLVTGYQPVLMTRQNVDGEALLAPYNIITTWYWVYEDANGNTRPVRETDLKAAWFENGTYATEVLAAFDANQDGTLDESELRIDSDAKRETIANRLAALGLNNVHIVGQMQPYSVNHNVARGQWAVNDCTACHSSNSRLSQPIQLAAYVPAGVMPTFAETNVAYNGSLQTDESGALYYTPNPSADGLYIFGHSRISWLDWFGALAFIGTLLGIFGHGGLRYLAARKQAKHAVKLKKVYMYTAYERFWHWLQMTAIVLLLLTGLVIHRPDMFGAFNFRYMVPIHNALAIVLVANAFLSLFYHLVSGEIKQYIPRPRGFFDQAIMQAKFYLQGIFKGEPHPFEKRPEKKLNPLQQATYFGLLNVLLPLQVVTGILMWGAQNWPEIVNRLGGLSWLAPLHSLIAWLLASFIVGHVYLTTTGPTVLTDIKAMITGWEEVEVHSEDDHPANP